MFKQKIFSRSSIDIKLYYSTWLADMTKLGYFSPERFRQKREERHLVSKAKVEVESSPEEIVA